MTRPHASIGQTPSPFRLKGTPVISVMLMSAIPAMIPLIAQSPVMPPLGLVVLLVWRLLHSDLWPVWIGVPLGAFNDIVTGQPLGTAILLWTIILIVAEIIDTKIIWRSYWHDWLLASAACAFYLTGALAIAWSGGSMADISLIYPQICWSVLLYPLMVRIIARLDRWRLMI